MHTGCDPKVLYDMGSSPQRLLLMVTFSEAGGKNGMLFNARMWLLAPLAKTKKGDQVPEVAV